MAMVSQIGWHGIGRADSRKMMPVIVFTTAGEDNDEVEAYNLSIAGDIFIGGGSANVDLRLDDGRNALSGRP